MTSVTVATWNVAWASPKSRRRPEIDARIAALSADLLVLTEIHVGLAPSAGFVTDGGDDWGYAAPAGRRKVVLWSRWPLDDVVSDAVTPGGRHVAATVRVDGTPVRVHAVCVPWSHAHVTGGRRDRVVWEDHMRYLDSLDDHLAGQPGAEMPLLVAGDMNQRPRGRAPRRVTERWDAIRVAHGLELRTSAAVIDQVHASRSFDATEEAVIPAAGLSDHDAVRVTLTLPITRRG